MRGICELGEELAEYLKERGLRAVTAWSPARRLPPGEPVAAVSLRGMRSGASGFRDYLGEWYDRETGLWEERYGKRAELIFGLDVYGGSARQVREGLDRLSLIFGAGGPGGLQPVELTLGEMGPEETDRGLMCPVEARFSVWLVETAEGAEGSFLDFEVRGERTDEGNGASAAGSVLGL